MQSLYKDPKEEAKHLREIQRLALESGLPVEDVRRIYEDEYARLKADAKVTEFIGVFASRRAHEALLRAAA